jgi:hypothetical protein
MVAPLVGALARAAVGLAAKQMAKNTGKEVAKKAAVEAAKKEVRPGVAKFEKKYKYEPGEYVEAVKKHGLPTTKGELGKANRAVTKGNKIDPGVTIKGNQSYYTNKAQQYSKKTSEGYDGVKFLKD